MIDQLVGAEEEKAKRFLAGAVTDYFRNE